MRYVFVTAAESKKEYKKGDRIVVSVDDDCFLATVTRVARGKIYLLFDDDDTGKVSVGSKRILGPGITRKVKKSFTKKEAKKYIKPTVKKVSRLKDTPRTTTVTRINRDKPKETTPQDKPAKRIPKKENEADSNNKKPTVTIEQPQDKTPKMSDYSDHLKYIADLWEFYNDKYFGGRMKKPKFSLKKNVDPLKLRGLGQYHFKFYRDGDRIKVVDSGIRISPFMFRDETKCREVLLHEMCHQATAELDGLDDGHGTTWSEWAKRCGVKASRLTNASDLFSDEEKQEIQRNAARTKSILDTASRGNAKIDKFVLEMPCKFYHQETKNYTAGRIVYILPNKVRILTFKDDEYTIWTVDKRIVFMSQDDGGVTQSAAEAYAEYLTVTSKRNVKGLAKDVRDSIARENLRNSLALDSVERNSTPIDKQAAQIGDPCYVMLDGKKTSCRIVRKSGQDKFWVVYSVDKTYEAKKVFVSDVTMMSSEALKVITRYIPNSVIADWEEYCNLAERQPKSIEALVAYYVAVGRGYELHRADIPSSVVMEMKRRLAPFSLSASERVEGAAVTTIDPYGHVVQGRIGFVGNNRACAIVYYYRRFVEYLYDSERVYQPALPLEEISQHISEDLVSACSDYYLAQADNESPQVINEYRSAFRDALAQARGGY